MTGKEAEMFYKQAISFMGQGETKKALEFFDKSVDIDQNYLIAWNDKGVAHLEVGEYQKARECFEAVNRLNPGDGLAWYNRGYALLMLEMYPESVKTFDFFLDNYSPKSEFYKFALYLKAKGLYALKEYEDAHETLEIAVKKDKSFKEARELLILVLREMNKEK
jgi:lipoprotein NlpI